MDWTFHVGDLLSVAALTGSILYFAYRAGGLSNNIEDMQKNITRLERAIEVISSLLTKVAVQDERIDHLDKRLEDLRRDFIEALDRFRSRGP